MSHTAELIAVGTEILLGNIANAPRDRGSRGDPALGDNHRSQSVGGPELHR